MIQQVKNKDWRDETGRSIPVEYISKVTRQKERYAGKILKESERITKDLINFKADISKLCDEIFEAQMKEFKVNPDYKGNFTWFNFDRSIKVEVQVNERIEFDDLTIKACKAKLDEYLDENIDSKAEFVKELITDAFSTSKGKLDTKKVMSLMKYRTKIMHPNFQDALSLLGEAIRRPDSKKYYKVWSRKEDGSYQLVDLNFSSI
jgi:hypothetical protein